MRKLYFVLLALAVSVASWAQDANVQIIHNSPTPGTDSGPTVDIYVNGDLLPALTAVPYRAATPFLPVPSGVDIEVAVAVSPSTSVDDAIATFPLGQLAADENYTVIANGIVGDMDTPFNLAVNAGAQQAAGMAGMVDLNVFHGSPDAPNVDVDVRDLGNVVSDLAYGDFTPYLSVAPDTYLLDVRATGVSDIVATFEADLSALGGGAATVFASGLLANTPEFGLFAALPDGQVVELPATAVARLQVIHNSPDPVVDIYVNDILLLNDVEFRTASEFLPVPAEVELNVAVAPANSMSSADAIATIPVMLENGLTYTATAGGVVGSMDTPFELQINPAALETSTEEDRVSFNVLHGSPDAPNVDIGVRTVGTVISDLEYGEYSDYLTVDTGLYYVDVRAAGETDIVATFEADLSMLADSAFTIIASGFLGQDPAFGLFAVFPNGDVVELPATEVARLQVIHNAPDPVVDVYVNGTLLLEDFEFRTASPFIFAPAGVTLNVGIAAAGSSSVEDTLANFPLLLENGETYVATANGLVGDMDFPLTISVNTPALEESGEANTVALAVHHGSPGAPAVAVDLRLIGNVIPSLAYGEYDGYFGLPADSYLIDIRAAGSEDIVATFEANLSGLGGQAVTVFASGILGGDPAFGLYAALPDGTVVELPATQVARAQIVHASPAPTVDIYVNGDLAVDDFTYQSATPFLNLPAGVELDVAVAPGDSESADDAIANFPVTLINGETYAIIAHGIVGDMENPFTLSVSDMAQETGTNPDALQVMAFHGSPGAPAVDVAPFADDAIITGLEYAAFTDGYLDLEPAPNTILEVRPEGGTLNDVVGTYFGNLAGAEGLSALVVATGVLGDADNPLDLLVVLPNGGAFTLVPVATANIIHNSPADIASTIDVYLDGEFLVLDDFSYQTASGLELFVTRQEATFGIAPADSEGPQDILFSTDPVTFQDGAFHTVIANGIPGDPDTPFELVVNTETEILSGEAMEMDITLFHGSQNAPAVDVTERQLGEQIIDGLPYGEFQGPLSLPSGTYYLEVRPDGADDLVATFETPLPTEFEGGGVVGVASGLVGDEPPFDLIFFDALGNRLRATPVAQVQVIHNSPDPVVDVYANDAELIPDFAFRTATGFVDLPTRTDISIDVAPGDSQSAEDAIATFDGVRFEDGKKYIVVATGIVGNMDTPFDLAVTDMAQTEAAGSGTDLLFYHGSPDAPVVDVVVDADGSVLYDDAAYGDFQGYVNVPAAEYQLNVTPGDDNNTIVKAYDADLSSLEGGAATVFASGLLGVAEGPTAFGVWVALPDGTTFPLSEITSTGEVADKFTAFQVAPNPVRDLAQVQYSITEPLQVVEEIRNIEGQLIRSNTIGKQLQGDHSREINATELPAGIYTYNLVTELGTITQRFVVIK